MGLDSGDGAASRSGLPRGHPPADDPAGPIFPEIDCVRRHLPPRVIAWAERRAERLGIGADRALIAGGILDEETYLRALANDLGIAFEPLDGTPRGDCPLDGDRLIGKAAAGILPLQAPSDAAPTIVIAPRGTAARGLAALVRADPASRTRFRLTSTERFNRFVLRAGREALSRRATEDLKTGRPMLSAASGLRLRGIASLTAIAALSLAATVLAPVITLRVFDLMLSAVFLAWLALRLTGACVSRQAAPADPGLPDRALPVYTVMAALYREAASVGGLLAAIERLDYPALGSKCTKISVGLRRFFFRTASTGANEFPARRLRCA